MSPPMSMVLVTTAPAADRPVPCIAGRSLDPVLAHVTRAAMDLEAFVRQLKRRSLGQQLGHRDLPQGLLARDESPQGVIGDASACVHRSGHVREAVADRLVTGEGPTEGVARARVLCG